MKVYYSPFKKKDGTISHRFHGTALTCQRISSNIAFEQDEEDAQIFHSSKAIWTGTGYHKISIRLIDHLVPVENEPIQAVLVGEGV